MSDDVQLKTVGGSGIMYSRQWDEMVGKTQEGDVFRATDHDCSLKKWPMDGTIHGLEGLDW